MKKSILILACAAIAPFAFAQTSTTTTEKTTTAAAPVTTTETTTYSSGTVTTYEPGKTIVVKGPEGPIDFVLGTTARILDGAGKIVTAPLRSGQKVRVYYTGTGEKRVVERVVVDE
jgi:ABC-type Fe3+-hydroxamate transport system substrate-binding protein